MFGARGPYAPLVLGARGPYAIVELGVVSQQISIKIRNRCGLVVKTAGSEWKGRGFES